MCVICVKSSKVGLDRESLNKCHVANPDLFGISVLDSKGVIHTWRGQSKLDRTLARIEKELPTFESLPMLFHFRIATSGKVNTVNSHPFPLDRRFLAIHSDMRLWESKTPVLVHNGVLAGMGDKTHSDTFNLAYMLTKVSHSEKVSILENMGGYSNKFAIMHTKGILTIGTFFEYDGMKYSNMNWNRTAQKYDDSYWENWRVGNENATTSTESVKDTVLASSIELCVICGSVLNQNEKYHPLRRLFGKNICDMCHKTTKHMTQVELIAYVDSLD